MVRIKKDFKKKINDLFGVANHCISTNTKLLLTLYRCERGVNEEKSMQGKKACICITAFSV